MTPPSTPKEKFQWVFLFERVNSDFFVMVKANGKKLVERNRFINIKRNGQQHAQLSGKALSIA